ncbi:MAG: ankyrin repeat domain-containing protein [Candidatus Aminicenantes bacterium]|nr:ankyrin repeat domain-containing protein [Candidatus Aminicenantes bacterium]
MKTKSAAPILFLLLMICVFPLNAQDLFNEIRHGNIENIKTILEKNPELVNTRQNGVYPLHQAVRFGQKEIATLLISKGAELNSKSTDGGTPLHFAEAAGKTDTAAFLKSRGAKEMSRNFPTYSDPYLGVKKPGLTPEPFAPELFRDIYRVHSTPAFSPDGKEVFWECIFMRGNNDASRVWTMKEQNGEWSPPRVAPFSKYPSGGPAFFHGGKKLVYFSLRPRDESARPAKDLDLWTVEREESGWGKPKHLDSPLNKDGSFEVYPLVAKDGTLYLKRGPQGYVKSVLVSGKYTDEEIIGDLFETDVVDDCRAMEHILFFSDRKRGERYDYEIYISFHKPDGRWSKPFYLGDRLHPGRRATQAAVTLDGKYLFFASYFYYYWVDAKIIENLKNKTP